MGYGFLLLNIHGMRCKFVTVFMINYIVVPHVVFLFSFFSYAKMQTCWNLDASSRPTFSGLMKFFTEFCASPYAILVEQWFQNANSSIQFEKSTTDCELFQFCLSGLGRVHQISHLSHNILLQALPSIFVWILNYYFYLNHNYTKNLLAWKTRIAYSNLCLHLPSLCCQHQPNLETLKLKESWTF